MSFNNYFNTIGTTSQFDSSGLIPNAVIQVNKMDGTSLSANNWTNLSTLNQGVYSGASPAFAGLDLTATSGSAIGLEIDNTLSDNHAVYIHSNQASQGALDYLVKIEAENAGYNQPLMCLISGGTAGGNAPCINMKGPTNCHIEMEETDQDNSTGKGVWEIGANANRLQFNSRNLANDAFETIWSIPQLQQTSMPIEFYKAMKLTVNPTASVGQLELSGTSTSLRFTESDQATPKGKWEVQVSGNYLNINSRNTGDSAFETVMRFPQLTETETPITLNKSIETFGNVTNTAKLGGSSLTAYNNSGINVLLDKTASTASFDLTGGAAENLFTDTSGPFSSDVVGKWIKIYNGTYTNALAKIIEHIDTDNIVLDTMGWVADFSGAGYYMISAPPVVLGDGSKVMFDFNSVGHMHFVTDSAWYGAVNEREMSVYEFSAGGSGLRCMRQEIECNGNNNIVGTEIDLIAGDLAVGDRVEGLLVNTDLTEATSTDATTTVACYIASTTGVSSATTKAFLALPGFDKALQVQGAPEIDPDYGYSIATTTVTDRVNGAPQAGTAFLDSSTSNVQLMTATNDFILLGSDATFEIIEVSLETPASKDCVFEFYYSKAGNNWTALSVIDSTNGFTKNGAILFTAPGDWTKDDQAIVNTDITEAYYVKIKRTEASTIVTKPVEDHFILRTSRDTGMEIRGDGSILPVHATDSAMPNDSIYYSETASKLVYKDSGGTVNNLY